MKKWEYKSVSFTASHSEVESMLNRLGEQGWELVALHEYHYVFKRPKM